MQIGCFSERPFLFNEKFFLQKPLILLGLFNITKKKLKKSSEKLFTFKKVVYICKVIKNENKMKTTIKTTDFSEATLQLFNEAKSQKSFLLAWDLVRILIDNDFPVKDVKQFMKVNFKNDYKFLDYSI